MRSEATKEVVGEGEGWEMSCVLLARTVGWLCYLVSSPPASAASYLRNEAMEGEWGVVLRADVDLGIGKVA